MLTCLFVCLLRLDNQHVLLMRFRLASAADRVLYSAVVQCGLKRSMLYCLRHGIPVSAQRPPLFSTDMLASRLRRCLRMLYNQPLHGPCARRWRCWWRTERGLGRAARCVPFAPIRRPVHVISRHSHS